MATPTFRVSSEDAESTVRGGSIWSIGCRCGRVSGGLSTVSLQAPVRAGLFPTNLFLCRAVRLLSEMPPFLTFEHSTASSWAHTVFLAIFSTFYFETFQTNGKVASIGQ